MRVLTDVWRGRPPWTPEADALKGVLITLVCAEVPSRIDKLVAAVQASPACTVHAALDVADFAGPLSLIDRFDRDLAVALMRDSRPAASTTDAAELLGALVSADWLIADQPPDHPSSGGTRWRWVAPPAPPCAPRLPIAVPS